jgi:hypothetical protein
MSGMVLEDRQVCCKQQAKDSLGCERCHHTDIVRRVLTQDPNSVR